MTKRGLEDGCSWDEFYKQNIIEERPWFEKELDKDGASTSSNRPKEQDI